MSRARRSTSTNGNFHRAEQPDPFRFGWRYEKQIGRDGSEASVQVPLTPDDLLHPRRGDVTPQDTWHEQTCRYLYSVLSWRLASNPRAMVLSDCLVDWGIRGLGDHSPDISVFDDVPDPDRDRWIVSVAKEQVRPVLVIEVVAPDVYEPQVRDNDVVTKVREYYRARVPLYFLVDREEMEKPSRVVGYRYESRKYVPMPLDDQGRLLLGPVRLWVGLKENHVVCWDADKPKEIGDFTEMARACQAADAALAMERQARDEAETALAAALARIRELEARGRNGG